MDNKCRGCRWHMPKKLGGEGFLCWAEDGKCPDWVIKWNINYGGLKATRNNNFNERLVECNRL